MHDDLRAHEVPSASVPPEVVGVACRVLDDLLGGLAIRRWPQLRWMRGAPLSGCVRDHPDSGRPRQLWLDADLAGTGLIRTVAHEARHLAQLEAGWSDRPTMETDADVFAGLVERRFLDGLSLVHPPLQAPERRSDEPSRPPVRERSPVPTARTATPSRPGVIVTPPRWQADRVPITIAGRTCFRCDPCGQLVAVGIPHACQSRRHVSGGSPDDD
jgi:hypothetical protein